MKLFEFSIVATGLDPQADDFETRFLDAGCDDATVSFQNGHIILDFAREAGSLDEAIASAVENVRAAGAAVERVEPDPLVSLSDIARRSNLTRAAITLYHRNRRGKDFPSPVARVTTDSPLWEWHAVAAWLFRRNQLPLEAAVDAAVVARANTLIQDQQFAMGETLRAFAAQCAQALKATPHNHTGTGAAGGRPPLSRARGSVRPARR